ncbi:MAG: septum formation inhibitor Maf [Bacterioplanes sp.]|nr:septum formation inhibitor Maf [Bacterioplanes sp.]
MLLASSSVYRRRLLEQLRIPFSFASPDVDESVLADESPTAYVSRLAIAKAHAMRSSYPAHWIIGSDQTCVLDGHIVGKSGSFDVAMTQLLQASGKAVVFYTGVCLLNARTGQQWQHVEPFTVHFRALAEEEIRHYLHLEQPYDCAGSFKVEGLGIQLFQSLQGRDSSSLIGLPLIALLDLMREAGLQPLLSAR